jgi:hypothetical protein
MDGLADGSMEAVSLTGSKGDMVVQMGPNTVATRIFNLNLNFGDFRTQLQHLLGPKRIVAVQFVTPVRRFPVGLQCLKIVS